jgi:hypothetical protein
VSRPLVASREVRADLITTNPDLPPLGGAYMTAAQVHAADPGISIIDVLYKILQETSRIDVRGE